MEEGEQIMSEKFLEKPEIISVNGEEAVKCGVLEFDDQDDWVMVNPPVGYGDIQVVRFGDLLETEDTGFVEDPNEEGVSYWRYVWVPVVNLSI